jgi:hypothetical protein
MKSPYTGLNPNRFWRTGVSEAHPLTVADLYRKKFAITASDKIATAGSCFAQHVANHLRTNGYSVMDVEPSPAFLPPESAKEFGYGIYSARYGNIYTVRQLLQLAQDAKSGTVDPLNIWTNGDRFYDALRPNIEPTGFDSPQEAVALREQHLAAVKRLFPHGRLHFHARSYRSLGRQTDESRLSDGSGNYCGRFRSEHL